MQTLDERHTKAAHQPEEFWNCRNGEKVGHGLAMGWVGAWMGAWVGGWPIVSFWLHRFRPDLNKVAKVVESLNLIKFDFRKAVVRGLGWPLLQRHHRVHSFHVFSKSLTRASDPSRFGMGSYVSSGGGLSLHWMKPVKKQVKQRKQHSTCILAS